MAGKLHGLLERMVSSGEETDNEKAEQAVATPQQQQYHMGKTDAHKPGSNGWGTCAELLLVSAVRKHGPLNWRLIALELKARALVLNTSPSCFSEEACRFRYNVLKGKFASSSKISSGNMGDDVGFDGGILVEELRKLRMSDLKQELQQYDSSIRQMQWKIRKMKDERAQVKTPSNIKQGAESNRAADLPPKAQKGSEPNTPVARKVDGPSDKAAGNDGKSHTQPEYLPEALSSSPFENADRRRSSSSMSEDGHILGTEVQRASTSKTVVKDLNDELQYAGESSSLRKSVPGQSHHQQLPVSEKEEPVKSHSVPHRGEGEFRVPPARDQEQGREASEKKNRAPASARPHPFLSRTASAKGEKDKEKGRIKVTGLDTTEQADITHSSMNEGLDVRRSPPRVQDSSGANQLSDGKESQKMADVKTKLEDRPRSDLPKEVGSGEAEAVLRQDIDNKVLDGELKENKAVTPELSVKKDAVSLKPPTISYGRSVSKSRSKLSEDGRVGSGHVSGTGSKQQQQVGEVGGFQNDRNKVLSKAPAPSPAEQRVEKGKAVGPSDEVVSGSGKGGSDSSMKYDSQEARDKVVELKDLSDVRKHSSKTMEFKDGREGKKLSGSNKATGSREGSDSRKLTTSSKVLGFKGITEEKKQVSNNNDNRTLVAGDAGEEKKHSGMNKKTGNCREVNGEKKFESGSKIVEARDIMDGKKTMSINKLVNMDSSKEKKLGSSSSKTSEARDVYDTKKPAAADAMAEVVGFSGSLERRPGRNTQSQDISPTPSAASGGDVLLETRRPDVSHPRKRSESPQVFFPEGVAAEGSRSPHLPQGGSAEQKSAAAHTDASQKLKRSESGKAAASSEGERKRKPGASKPSSVATAEARPVKRQWEEKPKPVNMDSANLKERKSDPKPKKVSNEGSDPLYKRESGDAEEESKEFLDSGERHQVLVDYDTNQIEKLEVASSMDSIEDMSPSGKKSRKEGKILGKFLPLLECLRVICAHKSAHPFRQRQEYQEKRNYNLVVRRHMDLGMIRSRLEEGAYSGSVEFFRDLLLMLTNALVYHSKDSQDFSAAKVLRSYALTEMEKILQTEALLKQHGPATRKREVRRSKEVHKNRLSVGSGGAEVRKKATGKNTSGEGADAEVSQQRTGSVENSQMAVASSPDGNADEREVDGESETFKKPTPNHVVREDNQRREAPKTEVNTEGNKSSFQLKSKNPKADTAAQPPKSRESEDARRAQTGHTDNAEKRSAEFPSKLKDVTSVEEGAGQKLTGGHSRPPQPTKTASASRSGPSTTRGSRYSKRAGESSTSNSKKRSRK
ncbi:hypothetical protein R1flu_009920 [Riccia fluitans]|uniref:Bromo domain-containing protein n=1 Tax=Riccia fluitans TaxID=41844 RepID=A0ABD1Z4E0_9MARC